jgi:hypothetical protein
MVGYVAQCALRGIQLKKLEIETHGEIASRRSRQEKSLIQRAFGEQPAE